MATVTDINIHAIPVYDGQSRSGLNPAQQGSNRSENFGRALSESSSQYHKNNKEQWVKKEAADSSTVESAPAAVTETSAAAASNRGEAQQRAINRQAEAASVATESSNVRDDPARQDLPVEGNALPKQAVTGMLNAENSGSRQSLQALPVEGNALPKQAVTGMLNAESSDSQQSLQALNRAKTQGSALTTQINQPQPALSETAPAAVTETSAAAASNQGEAQQRAIDKQAEAASVATESSSVRDEPARQDLPKQAVTGMALGERHPLPQSLQALNRANAQGSVLTTQINQSQPALSETLTESSSVRDEPARQDLPKQAVTGMALGERHPLPQSLQALNRVNTQGSVLTTQINQPQPALSETLTESSSVRDEPARQDLPKQAVTGMALGERHPLPQSLQALNRVNTQGSALTSQINQPQSALKFVEQSPTGAAIDPGDLDDGLAALLGRQAGLKDGAQAGFLRSPLVKPAQADSTPDGNRAQSVIAAQPVKAAEGAISRQDASALSAILAMPGLAEQAGKAPLAHSALAAAVVTQDRVADLDRRLRLQAAPMGGRAASNGLTTDARPSSTALSWQTPDGFADLLKKSASTTSQVTQISASVPTAQGLNTAQSGGAPVLPTLLDGNAMGGAFKLPSGFEISGGTAQGQMVTPFAQPAWAQELAQQAKFMVRDQLQFVELKLKPANLGSVEIVLKQDDDQTTLMFFTKNPAVREALEASLQKLQKSFDDDGLQLQQTVVSDQSLSEHRQQAASEAEQDQATGLNGAGASGDQSDITDQQAKLLIPANDQLLDLWA